MSRGWEPFYEKLQKVINGGEINENTQICLMNDDKQNIISRNLTDFLQNSHEMNDTIELLKTENDRLTQKFDCEKIKCKLLQQKLKTILKNQELFEKMKEEYQAMSRSVKERKLNTDENRYTLMNSCMGTREKCIQINMDCQQCLATNNLRRSGNNVQRTTTACQVNDSENSYTPRRDANRLQEDINTLKELLNEREIIWGKLATRERIQRLQINRLRDQLEDLHQMEFKQRVELELKNNRLQELNKELEREKMLVRKFKKLATKSEDIDKDLIKQRELNSEMHPGRKNVQAEHGKGLLP